MIFPSYNSNKDTRRLISTILHKKSKKNHHLTAGTQKSKKLLTACQKMLTSAKNNDFNMLQVIKK